MDLKYNLSLLIIVLICIQSHSEKDNSFRDLSEEKIESESHNLNGDSVATGKQLDPKPTPQQLYKWKFAQFRRIQQQTMQTIFKKVSQKTQMTNLVDSMLTKLFEVMLEAKSNLTKVGYVAGDEFPEKEETRESLSKVLENTFMFADTILRRPKVVHAKYDMQPEWKAEITWGYHISTHAGITNDVENAYLDLMAKEAGILSKDEDFVNPYLDESEKPRRKRFEDPKPTEKKKPKKKKERGPRLSHTEL